MNDYERISLKTLAWKNHGDFPFSCNKCTDKEKEIRNCEMKENHTFSLQDEEYILTTCPLNYILSTHTPFIDKYFYIKEFPLAMGSYETCQAEFWEMYAYYKNEATKHEIEKQKQDMNDIKQNK